MNQIKKRGGGLWRPAHSLAHVECTAKQQPFERVLTTPHVKETAPNSTGHPQTSHCELQLAIMLS